ncbi:hypothetical protein ACGF13_29525 [Kitasatospora sp. NPDC048286]|uniref:hypothetical protein n=1 Tax=unclassified Kitasatospora TaxID=2633591 RepID=UPI003714CC1C
MSDVLRAIHRCDEVPVVIVDGFDSAEDSVAGSGPAVTVTVCEGHLGAAEAWTKDFHSVVRADKSVGQRCGWVHDFRQLEVVLQAHVDAWLSRLSGLDLADYDDWAAYLSAAHEWLCTLHGLEPGHLGGGGAVSAIGMAASEGGADGLEVALHFLGHAEILAAVGMLTDSPGSYC